MSESFSISGIKGLFLFPLRGKEWGRKLLYLGLFWLAGSMIPMIPWLFVGGYFAAVVRKVVRDEAEKLPEWQDWNRLILDGIRMLGAGLIFFLPLGLFFSTAFSFYFGTSIVGIALGRGGKELASLLSSLGGMLVFGWCMAVGMFLSLLLGLIAWPATTHMIVEERFSALFEVNAWWKVVRANPGGYLIALFLFWGVFMAFQVLSQWFLFTVVLCVFLPVIYAVAMPYLTLLTADLFGQVYRESLVALGKKAPSGTEA